MGRRRRTRLRPELERCEQRIILDGHVTAAARHGPLLKANSRLTAIPPLPRIVSTQTARNATSQAPAAFQVPGDQGATVRLTFTLTKRQAWYRNEGGLFLVDDARADSSERTTRGLEAVDAGGCRVIEPASTVPLHQTRREMQP
jgi:hypothetical protein